MTPAVWSNGRQSMGGDWKPLPGAMPWVNLDTCRPNPERDRGASTQTRVESA